MLLNNRSPSVRHTVRPNNAKTLQFGRQKGLLHVHVNRWVAHTLRSPKITESSHQSPLKSKKGEGGMRLVVANLLVRSFVLEVRSWPGDDVSVNHYQMNVVLWLDKKGQGAKVQLSPCKVLVLAKRRQSSVGSSLRAGSPGSTQLSSLKKPGAQPSWLSGSSGHPKWETRSHRLRPSTLPLLLGCREQNGREGHCCRRPGLRLAGECGEGSEALQDSALNLFSGAPAHLLAQGWVTWRAWKGRPGFTSDLILHLTTTAPLLSESPH